MSDLVDHVLSGDERAWLTKAIRRKALFLRLSQVGVAIAAGLALVYGWERMHDAELALGPRAVIVLLVLLNARQNLRQHKYAAILEKLVESRASAGRGS